MHMKPDVEYLVKKYPSAEAEIRSLAKTAPKRIIFCLKMVELNGNKTQSYLATYSPEIDPKTLLSTDKRYEIAGTHGARLANDGRVKTLLDTFSHEATAAICEKVELSKQKILDDLEEIKQKGLEINQLGPATRATELQGKEMGMFVDRSEQMHRVADGEVLAELANVVPELKDSIEKAIAIPAEFSVTDNVADDGFIEINDLGEDS